MLRPLLLVVAISGCSAAPVSPSYAPQTDPLIGGTAAVSGQFPSTVALPSCTAVKVSPRHFMTAAHCVIDRSAIASSYVAGATLTIARGVSLDNAERYELEVVRTMIHARYLDRVRHPEEGEALDRCKAEAIDVALIEVRTATDTIPSATVDFGETPRNTDIVVGGYGCEQRPLMGPQLDGTYITAGDGGTFESTQRLKFASAQVSYVDDATFNFRNGDEFAPLALCQGDSGGPVYRNDLPAGEPIQAHVFTRVVGVNACGGLGASTMTRIDDTSPFQVGACLRTALDRAPDAEVPMDGGVSLLCTL